MKDFLGNELSIGDDVVYSDAWNKSSFLQKGRIEKFSSGRYDLIHIDGSGMQSKRVFKITK